MRRSDRLFELIQILRDGRLHTARALAERVEVSVRTIWRDMASLQASGLPVDGERGVGYILRERIDLPPLTLTPDEVEALRLGAALVARGADTSLARAAELLRAKVESVLPDRLRRAPSSTGPYIFTGRETEDSAIHLPPLRHALREQLKVRLVYRDAAGDYSTRTVRPLQLEFWGRVWTLAAWCEARSDFRTFRLDRIEQLTLTDSPIPFEPGRELDDYLNRRSRPPPSDGPWDVEHSDQDWDDDQDSALWHGSRG
jgi:predicted DNA-binding transcriptional regulator YafY